MTEYWPGRLGGLQAFSTDCVTLLTPLKYRQRVRQAKMVCRKPFLKLTFLSTLHN